MPDVAALFAEHHASLYRYLVRLGGDAELAADAAQEAFARAIGHALPAGAERAWLFRVATNVVLEQTRTATRRTRLLGAAPLRVPVGDAPPDPWQRLEAAERRRAVTRALETLSAKERVALLMREEGFTHREIAAAVGTTTGSVGTLVARALERLAAALGLDGADL